MRRCLREIMCLYRQVNTQAYLLWEKAGRPDGADFAQDARATLEAQLRSGKSVQDLEATLKAPEPKVARPRCLMINMDAVSWLESAVGYSYSLRDSALPVKNMSGMIGPS